VRLLATVANRRARIDIAFCLHAEEIPCSKRHLKLEMCADILTVLAHHGPLKLTHVMHKTNLNCGIVKVYFDFLIKQGLVEEHHMRKTRTVYAVAQRGIPF